MPLTRALTLRHGKGGEDDRAALGVSCAAIRQRQGANSVGLALHPSLTYMRVKTAKTRESNNESSVYGMVMMVCWSSLHKAK